MPIRFQRVFEDSSTISVMDCPDSVRSMLRRWLQYQVTAFGNSKMVHTIVRRTSNRPPVVFYILWLMWTTLQLFRLPDNNRRQHRQTLPVKTHTPSSYYIPIHILQWSGFCGHVVPSFNPKYMLQPYYDPTFDRSRLLRKCMNPLSSLRIEKDRQPWKHTFLFPPDHLDAWKIVPSPRDISLTFVAGQPIHGHAMVALIVMV